MGRSVSYPSDATVVTFKHFDIGGTDECGQCEGTGTTDAMGEEEECPVCDGTGQEERDADFDWECIVDDFRDHLKTLFPSVSPADDWIGREDHVLAENRLARFGMSEYCGLVAYWIVPSNEEQTYHGYDRPHGRFADAWVRKIADKFVKAFGELSKVGSMSNGEGVYRRIEA